MSGLYGALLGGAGTGVNMYADHKTKRAMQGAMGRQDQAIDERNRLELEAAERAREQQMGLSRRKFGAIDQMLSQFAAPTTDTRAQDRITSTVAAGTPATDTSNSPQGGWFRRAQAPVAQRTNNLMTLAGDAALQDAQTQQRGDALSGFNRADQALGVESRDFNALADVEGSARNRAWQQKLRLLQRAFTKAQGAGDDARLWGSLLGGAGQVVGSMSAGQPAEQETPSYVRINGY